MENHWRQSVRYCEMCGGEINENGDAPDTSKIHPEASTQITSIIRYMADLAYVSRIAPAIISLKVAHPEISEREIARILKIKKSSVNETIKRTNDKTFGVLEKILHGTRYGFSVKQRHRRKQEISRQ